MKNFEWFTKARDKKDRKVRKALDESGEPPKGYRRISKRQIKDTNDDDDSKVWSSTPTPSKTPAKIGFEEWPRQSVSKVALTINASGRNILCYRRRIVVPTVAAFHIRSDGVNPCWIIWQWPKRIKIWAKPGLHIKVRVSMFPISRQGDLQSRIGLWSCRIWNNVVCRVIDSIP